jgi:hypothetical protein
MRFVKWLRTWFERLGGLFHKARRDAEFPAELETQLQFLIEDNLRAGITPEAARHDSSGTRAHVASRSFRWTGADFGRYGHL